MTSVNVEIGRTPDGEPVYWELFDGRAYQHGVIAGDRAEPSDLVVERIVRGAHQHGLIINYLTPGGTVPAAIASVADVVVDNEEELAKEPQRLTEIVAESAGQANVPGLFVIDYAQEVFHGSHAVWGEIVTRAGRAGVAVVALVDSLSIVDFGNSFNLRTKLVRRNVVHVRSSSREAWSAADGQMGSSRIADLRYEPEGELHGYALVDGNSVQFRIK
jgi:hypothetical protein